MDRWGVLMVLMYLFTGRLWWTAGCAYGSDVFIYRATLVGRWGVLMVQMYIFTG